MKIRLLSFVVLLFACHFGASAADTAYEVNDEKLSPASRALYLEARDTLDDWSGQNEKLTAASAMIESFAKSEPNFLPIYHLKARLLIMTGYVGQNDPAKFNQDALKVIRDIQQKDPNYASAYVLAGHAYTNLTDYGNARRSLERASILTTTDPWLYLNWSELYARTNQRDKAVESAQKGLLLANQNGKALVSAIYLISKYSPNAGGEPALESVTSLVFNSFKDPLYRLALADRITAASGGRAQMLAYAKDIISRQKKETPDIPEADLSMAELFMQMGFRVIEDEISKYDPRYSSYADNLLASISVTDSTKTRIFERRFEIALSNSDLKKASGFLIEAERAGVKRDDLLASRARLMWLARDYAGVIRTLEDLASRNPSYGDLPLLGAAYARSGRVDKLVALRRLHVERNPGSAWALGNLAGTLLFDADDIDGAIAYGNKALREMPYPLARNTTSLAYLIKASVLNEKGDVAGADNNYAMAVSIGISDQFVSEYCGKYCASINKLRQSRPAKKPKLNLRATV